MFKLENNTSTQFDSPEEASRLADAFTFGLIDKLLEKAPSLFVKFMAVKKQFESMMKAETEAKAAQEKAEAEAKAKAEAEAKAKAEAEAKAKAEAEAKAKAEAEAEEKAAQEKAEEPWSMDRRINRLEALLRRLSKKLDLE